MGTTYYPIQRALEFHRNERGGVFSCIAGTIGAARVEFAAWAPNILRVRATAGSLSRPKPPSYVSGAPGAPEMTLETSARAVVLHTPAVVAEVQLDPWTIGFRLPNGRGLTHQVHDDTDLTGTVLGPAPGFEVEDDGELNVPVGRVVRSVETLRLDPADHFYGLGEKFTRFDKVGQTIAMWQHNAYGARTERAYKNIPFFMTPRGYGLFVDSTARVVFHLGTLSSRSFTIEVPGDEVDYYLIVGSPAEILEAYASLTGKPTVPPKWAFGLWASTSFIPATQDSVLARAERLRAERIPSDVMNLDCYWQAPMRWSELEWDRQAFPNPSDLLAALHRLGFRVCLWENPYVSIHTRMFEEGAARGYFVRQPDGSITIARLWGGARASLCAIVDVTNPEAAAWFREKHRPLLEMGADTFKTDFAEEIPEDAVFHNGERGAVMRNLYALLYQQLVFETVQQHHGRGIIWARAGAPGVQRFPVHWSGDPHCTYEDMAATLRGGLSAALSGLAFWSHDIGGFWGTPTANLFIRWAQFGLLSAFSRYHGASLRDPWEFGEDAVAIFRRYTLLRYRLIPYLYSTAWQAARTGLPVMRPMVLAFPDDPATYTLDLQFMLGDTLLVAPVFDPDGQVTVYLPDGPWVDFWTGGIYRGPATIRRVVPLDECPLFVRGESLLPLGPEVQRVGERPADPLTIEAYMQDRAGFVLHDDDGDLALSGRREGRDLIFEASDTRVTYVVRAHGWGAPEAIEADGRVLPGVAGPAALEERAEGWSPGERGVVVKARARAIRLRGCKALTE